MNYRQVHSPPRRGGVARQLHRSWPPGAKREPDRAKPQLVVSSAKSSGLNMSCERPPRLRRFCGFATFYYCRSHPSFPRRGMLAILLLFCSSAHAANLLIQGATLIDGTGKAPIPDARILIEGNVIRRIWNGAEPAPTLPPGTQMVDARGKFVIPGLIDSHVHYRPYMGEMFLAHGVTTVYDLGNPLAWQTAVKKGLNSGKIRGPRFYFCSGITIGNEPDGDASGELASRNPASMRT